MSDLHTGKEKIVTHDAKMPNWPQVLAGYRLLLAIVDPESTVEVVEKTAEEFVARNGGRLIASRAKEAYSAHINAIIAAKKKQNDIRPD